LNPQPAPARVHFFHKFDGLVDRRLAAADPCRPVKENIRSPAALNAAAYMIGQPLLQVTLDNCNWILRIASGAVHLPPEGDGYMFESLPGIIKWPLRIVIGSICGVILYGALLLLTAIFIR
jgi:hypothetical protein